MLRQGSLRLEIPLRQLCSLCSQSFQAGVWCVQVTSARLRFRVWRRARAHQFPPSIDRRSNRIFEISRLDHYYLQLSTMSKRSVTEIQTASTSDNRQSKRPFGAASKQNGAEDEIGEFEDGWEDEFESDGEVVDGEAEDGA